MHVPPPSVVPGGMNVFISALVLAFLAAPVASPSGDTRVDVLLRGGTIVDGGGAPPFVGDVGIVADRIAFVGDANTAHVRGRRTIDVHDLVVAPGFIDPHTHTMDDLSSHDHKGNVNYLMQGVTTVVTGNDGSSAKDIGGALGARYAPTPNRFVRTP